MRVLHVIRYYYPHLGGNENQAKLLIENLQKNYNINNTIVTSQYDRKLPQLEEESNVNIIRLSHFLQQKKRKRPRNPFIKLINKIEYIIQEYTFLIELFWFLKKEASNFNIIHVHQTSWLSLVPSYIGRRFKIKVIVKEATFEGFKYLKYILIPIKFSRITTNYAHFIGISNKIMDNLQKKISRERLHYIPNGVVIPPKNHVQKSYRDPEKIILFVGNFSHGTIKGLDILIKATNLIYENYPNFSLNIIGEGDPKPFYDLLIYKEIKDKINFWGSISDVTKYYENSDVFVLPSRSEGMSNSLLEAMAFGIPSVATSVSGVDDIIINSQNGFIVNIEDYNTLAKRIIEIFNNEELAKQFSLNSRRTIEQNFSIEVISTKYCKLYKKIYENDLQ